MAKSKMEGLISQEQWYAWKGKFHWMRHRTSELSEMHTQIIKKWIVMNISGWWYFDKSGPDSYLYVFENEADMVMFKVWLSDRPFEREFGEIDGKTV